MEGFPVTEVPNAGEEEKLELTLGLEIRPSVGGSPSKKPKRAVKALKGSKPAEESKVLPLFHTDGPDLSDPDRKRQYHAFRRKEAKRRQDEKRLRRGIVRGQAPAVVQAPPASTSSPAIDPEPPVQNVGVREHGRKMKEKVSPISEALQVAPKSTQNSSKKPMASIPETAPTTPKSTPSSSKKPNPTSPPMKILNPTPISIAMPNTSHIKRKTTLAMPNPNPIQYNPAPSSVAMSDLIPIKHKPAMINVKMPSPTPIRYNTTPSTVAMPNPTPLKRKPTPINVAMPNPNPMWYDPTPMPNPTPNPMQHNLAPMPNPSPMQYNPTPMRNPNPMQYDLPPPVPMMPPYQPVPVVPYTDGYAYPYMVPYWPMVSTVHRLPPSFTAANDPIHFEGDVSLPMPQPPAKFPPKSILRVPSRASVGKIPSKVSFSLPGGNNNSNDPRGKSVMISDRNLTIPESSSRNVNKLDPVFERLKFIVDPNNETEMPFVGTTGDDGRIITGILYNYKRGELNIMCTCHKITFTPAGFMEHAGSCYTEDWMKSILIIR